MACSFIYVLIILETYTRKKQGKISYEVGKGKPPKSTQFKKGKSGNPDGGRKHNQDLKILRRVLKSDLVEKLLPLLNGTLNDLSAVLKNKDSSALELAFASVLLRAIKKGNWSALNGVVDFLIGPEPKKNREEQSRRTKIIEKRIFTNEGI